MRRQILTISAAIAAVSASLGLGAGSALAARGPAATATLHLDSAFVVHRRVVDVPARAIEVTGEVSRYAPGQHLTLVVDLGHRQVAVHRLSLRALRSGRGRFSAKVTATRPGILRLSLSHRATAGLAGFQTSRAVQILAESTGDAPYVALVQQRLAALHLYLPPSGRWDLQTELAVTAYHRLLGRGTSSALDPATLTDLLDGVGTFTVRFPHQGRHVEGDLSDQLVALVDGARVVAIYPISSGKPSTPTILGSYRIYRRVPGYLPDGMYYSDFFIRGYAVHGYDPAPDYPASHGCMRLPISDAVSAFDWLALGDWVDVYGAPSGSV